MPEAPAQPVEIRAEGLFKSFRSNPVLNGIDLEIRCGEIVAIVGGSGSGKTVLLNHLIGLLIPDTGRVLIADRSPAAPSPGELIDITTADEATMDRIRTQWAVVFQRNALFSGTVFQNIALWPREIRRMKDRQIRPIAIEALTSVGFKDPISILDRERDQLSGGMAKRVAIARAVAMRPRLMFFDEPTTGLDPSLAAQIHDLVFELHQHTAAEYSDIPRTTVIITHDKDLLHRIRPRVVMLYEGRVFFDGSYKEFEQSDSPIVRPYFQAMGVLQARNTDLH